MVELNASDKLARARVQLSRSQPFFAYLAFSLRFVEDKSVPTMGVNDRGYLIYNPAYVEGLKSGELEFALTHEVMHCALMHTSKSRLGGRDPIVWNMAGDYVINTILKDSGVGVMPPGLLYDGVLGKGETTEEVYDKIMRNAKRVKVDFPMMGKGGCYQPSDGHEHDGEGEGISKGKVGAGVDWKAKLNEAAVHARQMGKFPSGVDRLVEAINEPPLDWRSILHQKFQGKVTSRMTYSRPNRRNDFEHGVILPGKVREGANVLVAIDTSGSIGSRELGLFLNEIRAMFESAPGSELTLMSIDCAVHEVRKVASWDDVGEFNIKGGGGSSMVPAFDWLLDSEDEVDMVVVLTDGFIEFPKDNPKGVDTVWVGVAGEFKVPFGLMIPMRGVA